MMLFCQSKGMEVQSESIILPSTECFMCSYGKITGLYSLNSGD